MGQSGALAIKHRLELSSGTDLLRVLGRSIPVSCAHFRQHLLTNFYFYFCCFFVVFFLVGMPFLI